MNAEIAAVRKCSQEIQSLKMDSAYTVVRKCSQEIQSLRMQLENTKPANAARECSGHKCSQEIQPENALRKCSSHKCSQKIQPGNALRKYSHQKMQPGNTARKCTQKMQRSESAARNYSEKTYFENAAVRKAYVWSWSNRWPVLLSIWCYPGNFIGQSVPPIGVPAFLIQNGLPYCATHSATARAMCSMVEYLSGREQGLQRASG